MNSFFLASLMKRCSSSLEAVGRLLGSLFRHKLAISRSALEKCLPLESGGSSGGGNLMVLTSTLSGASLAMGAWP